MVKKAEIPAYIVDRALALAAERGWRRTSLREIAGAAGVSLIDLRRHYRSKGAILEAFFDRVDHDMLAAVEPELESEPARDRLFDLIMRRFDAMKAHKEGVRAILRDCACDPCLGLWAWCRMRRSLSWILEAAGLDSSGLRGLVRIKGLGLVYLPALRVWLNDDSEDMARTMADLDRRLGRLDNLVATLSGRGAPRAAEEGSESA